MRDKICRNKGFSIQFFPGGLNTRTLTDYPNFLVLRIITAVPQVWGEEGKLNIGYKDSKQHMAAAKRFVQFINCP